MQSGLSPRLGEYSNVGRESEKAKQPSFGICSIRSIWLQVPSFPRARPRMYRREVWVASLNRTSPAVKGTRKPARAGGLALGTSTRFSKGMIKSQTEASRMVRGGRQPTVRGALYEGTSIAA